MLLKEGLNVVWRRRCRTCRNARSRPRPTRRVRRPEAGPSSSDALALGIDERVTGEGDTNVSAGQAVPAADTSSKAVSAGEAQPLCVYGVRRMLAATRGTSRMANPIELVPISKLPLLAAFGSWPESGCFCSQQRERKRHATRRARSVPAPSLVSVPVPRCRWAPSVVPARRRNIGARDVPSAP